MSTDREAPPQQPVTIYDISRIANVSPSTVSRALSTPGRLNKSTEERIRSVADSLGYRPNRSALGLSTGKTRCLGLVAPNVSNPFFAEFLRAFQHAADVRGYVVMFVDVNEDEINEADAIRRLRVQTDGLALCAPRAPAHILTSLIEPSKTVVFNRQLGGAHCIVLDSSSALQQAISNLNSEGHHTFLYVPDAPHAVGDRIRRQVCRQSAVDFNMTMILDEALADDREKAVHAVKVAKGSKASAILAHSDMVAMWILHECHLQGIKVPEAISIVGHDNIEYAAATTPPMTTVDAQIAKLASRMAEMLMDAIEDPGQQRSHDPAPETVEAVYVERSTVGRPAAVSAVIVDRNSVLA